MENIYFWALLAVSSISSVYSLECYSCVEQDSNTDKCVTTTKQCEQHKDICLSYIRWGIPPYWNPHGERIYHISKDCARRSECERLKAESMTHCKRDWYDDWACYECCSGDLCNYYVTMGSDSAKSSFATTLVIAFSAVYLWWQR